MKINGEAVDKIEELKVGHCDLTVLPRMPTGMKNY